MSQPKKHTFTVTVTDTTGMKSSKEVKETMEDYVGGMNILTNDMIEHAWEKFDPIYRNIKVTQKR